MWFQLVWMSQQCRFENLSKVDFMHVLLIFSWILVLKSISAVSISAVLFLPQRTALIEDFLYLHSKVVVVLYIAILAGLCYSILGVAECGAHEAEQALGYLKTLP